VKCEIFFGMRPPQKSATILRRLATLDERDATRRPPILRFAPRAARFEIRASGRVAQMSMGAHGAHRF